MAAGLPNASGETRRDIKSSSTQVSTTEWYGCVGYKTENVGSYGGNSTSYWSCTIYVDLSKDNAIYGNSTTVTPLSLSCKYIISY